MTSLSLEVSQSRPRMLNRFVHQTLEIISGWNTPRRRRMFTAVLFVGVVAATAGIAFFAGDSHAVQSLKVVAANPTDLGNAMQQDNFYSSFRESTLIVAATATTVDRVHGTQVVTLASGSSYTVRCRMATSSPTVRTGEGITVVTEGATASREAHGVQLNGCVVP